MTEVTEFIFTYTPWDKQYPIKFVTVHIVAKTKEEAKKIADFKTWTFFNQDNSVEITEGLKGYIND